MGRLVDLDALIPEDVTFAFRGDEYKIPGDIPVENMLRLIRAVGELERDAEGEGWDPQDAFEQDAEALLKLGAELLALFQIRHPDMQTLPFTGGAALRVIVGELLRVMGVVAGEEPDEDGESGPPPKSASSTGSRRSRSNSAGRRTTGRASAGAS